MTLQSFLSRLTFYRRHSPSFLLSLTIERWEKPLKNEDEEKVINVELQAVSPRLFLFDYSQRDDKKLLTALLLLVLPPLKSVVRLTMLICIKEDEEEVRRHLGDFLLLIVWEREEKISLS